MRCVLAAARFGQPHFLGAAFLERPHTTLPCCCGIAGLIALYVLWRRRGAFDDKSLNDGFVTFAIAAGLASDHRIPGARYVESSATRACWRAISMARWWFTIKETDGSMGPVRVLRHGTIDHGEQFLWPQNQRFADHLLRREIRASGWPFRSCRCRVR